MMNQFESQNRVLEYVRNEFIKVDDINSINKIYRQARAWNRWNQISLGLEAKTTNPEYNRFNEALKNLRDRKRAQLERKKNG